uniref:Saposin B-type domain-containing protein n=1 Tax=Rhabditophanes sp. KR3021 TaxID=114890 RepID=A0AC35UAA1_9BILA
MKFIAFALIGCVIAYKALSKVSCPTGTCFDIVSRADNYEIIYKGCMDALIAAILKPFGIGMDKEQCATETFKQIRDVEATVCVCKSTLCSINP